MDLSQLSFVDNGIEELYRASPFSRIIPGENIRSNRTSHFVSPPVQGLFQVPRVQCPRLARPKKYGLNESASVVKAPVSNWSRRSSGIVSEEEVEENQRFPSSPGHSDCSYFFSQKETNTLKTLETFNSSDSPPHPKVPSPRKNLTPEFLASKTLHVVDCGSKRLSSSPVKASLDFNLEYPVPQGLGDQETSDSEFADISAITNISVRKVSKLDLFKSLQTESGYSSKIESKTIDESSAVDASSVSSEGCIEFTEAQHGSDPLPVALVPSVEPHCRDVTVDDTESIIVESDQVQESEVVRPLDTDTMVSHRLRKRNCFGNTYVKKSALKQSEQNVKKNSRAKPKSNSAGSCTETNDEKESEKEGILKRKTFGRGSNKAENTEKYQRASAPPQQVLAGSLVKATPINKVSPDPQLETPKVQKINTSICKEMRLKDWFLQPVNNVKGIIVEGDRADVAEGGLWHSTCIVDCIDSRSVQTASGSVYKLVGNISIADTAAQGFTKKFAKAFKTGFPNNWRDLVAAHFNKPRRAKPKPQNTTSVFETPATKLIDVSMCKRTSSGRTIIPSSSIEWWKCVRVRVNKDTSAVEIRNGVESFLDSSEKMKKITKLKKSKTRDTDSPDFMDPVESSNSYARRKSGPLCLKNNTFAAILESEVDKKKNKNVTKKTKQKNGGKVAKAPKSICYKPRLKKVPSVSFDNDITSKRGSAKRNSNNFKVGTKPCDVVITPFVVAERKWKDKVSNLELAKKAVGPGSLTDLNVVQNDTDKTVSCPPKRGKRRNQPVKERCRVDGTVSETSNEEAHKPKEATRCRKKGQRSSAVNVDLRSDDGEKNSNVRGQRSSVGEKRSSVAGKKRSGGSRKCGSSVREKGRSSVGEKRRSGDLVTRRSSCGEVQQTAWSLNEIEKFKMAARQYSQTSPSFWLKVSSLVGKSEEECRAFHYKDAPESSAKKKPNVNSKKKPDSLELSGKNGTLKRKKQMRNIMEKFNEDYDSDFFDSTPFKKQKVLEIDDFDDVDQNDYGCPDTPFSLQTPGLVGNKKMQVMPNSNRKTPHCNVLSSAVLRSHNKQRREKDLVIHRKMKGKRPARKLLHARRESLASTPGIPRMTENQKSVIFHVTDADDQDDEEDQDYYWSDEELQ